MRYTSKAVEIGVLGIVLALLSGAMVAAQPQDSQAAQNKDYDTARPADESAMQTRDDVPPRTERLEKARTLIGMPVVNKTGTTLGTLDDIVVNEQGTAISYGAVAYGGFFGLGDRRIAVPWSAIDVHPNRHVLVVDADPAALSHARGFSWSSWPGSADADWQHPSATPARVLGTADDRRVTEMVRWRANDPQGHEIGDLQDIMVDIQPGPNDGKLAYALVAVRRGFLDLQKDLALVPWSAVHVAPGARAVTLNTTKANLEAVAFAEGSFPNLQDRQYVRDLHQRFDATPYWESLAYSPDAEPQTAPSMVPPASEPPQLAGPISPDWQAGSKYNRYYTPGKVSTLTGTIETVGMFRPSPRATVGLSLRVRTTTGTIVMVQAGPLPYMNRQSVAFRPGDHITITGAAADVGWNRVFIASDIRRGGDVVILRNPDGTPKWSAGESGQP
jgi:sporulation protein YlmC with PRC-barrel domain